MDKTIYDTMDKTMVLYRELWNLDLLRKKHGRFPKVKKLSFIMEKSCGNIPKQVKFLNKLIALEC